MKKNNISLFILDFLDVKYTKTYVPLQDNYRVEIVFPCGLTTNYGICLPVMQEMKATVGIVTEELRLIEHLFQPLRKILREGF